MSTPYPPATNLFGDHDDDDDDFELSFRTARDATPPESDFGNEWSDPDPELSDSTESSLYLLGNDWQERLFPKLDESIQDSSHPHSSLFSSFESEREITSEGWPSQRLPSVIFPDVDDEIYGFRLLGELGRGTFARVFLAKQGNLPRQVVLKISLIEGSEPQTLAQLQHTHIVPIYSVHEELRTGLRAVCMPYFGGATLSKILDAIWKGKPKPEHGRTFLEGLDAVTGAKPGALEAQPTPLETHATRPQPQFESAKTARNELAKLNYVQTAAWIVCRLAEGLQHSHERNVMHRDIKPSNILVSSEAVPLLLDFNVSQAIDCNLEDATLGGTVAYMAPEQLRAVMRRDIVSLAKVTHQSDIYSLGLVLYEMLSGPGPFVETAVSTAGSRQLETMLAQREAGVPSIRKSSLLPIPWSLESIVQKCLAANTAERYATAGQLAEDLTCFLEYLPLKFAPEPIRWERVQKWKRRHPRLTTSAQILTVCALLFAAVGYVLNATMQDLAVSQNLLTEAEAGDRVRAFEDGTKKSLCLVNTVIPNEDTLRSGLLACEETLAIYSVLQNQDWQEGIYWQRMPKEKRIEVTESVRELILVLASARVRASNNQEDSVRGALDLLQRAEEIRELPRSRALVLDRARYLRLLNHDNEARIAMALAKEIPAVTSHDLYMLACAHARYQTIDGYQEAVRLLTTAIESKPGHFWSFFERALCQQALGETVLAVSDLGTCIGLWPESSWAYFNHAFLLDQRGGKAEAVADYTKAITYSPAFVSAYYNRGLVQLELRRYAAALKDFEKVIDLGRDDVFIRVGMAMALEGLGEYGRSEALFTEILTLPLQSKNSISLEARQRLESSYAFAIAHRAPDKARKIFDGILKISPNHAHALYGRGMLFMEQEQFAKAIETFNSALDADPKLMEPLRYRAVAQSRVKEFELASADAQACLEREPTNPDSLYIAACVAARAAAHFKNDELIEEAIELLKSAIKRGADRDRARDDPDFDGIKDDPEFRKLISPPTPVEANPEIAPV